MSHYKKGRQFFLLICLFCITVFAHAKLPETVGLKQSLSLGEVPDGLSTNDWKSIQAQVQAGKYKVYPDDDSYHSSNPAHGWRIRYGADGTTTLSPHNRDTGAYHLGLKLNAIGYQTLKILQHPQHISSENNTLNYHWNNNLIERWVNSATDLEQWFILNQRPKGATSGQLLTLQLTVNSDLNATQDGNNIRFVNQSGTTTITYNKLKVWDATGRQLLAHMQLDAQQLSLMIDDSAADYPLTIDPSFQQQAYLKASNTNAFDAFGFSVAIAGDTLVVGAPGEASNATGVDGDQSDNSVDDSGAAYVFIRNGSTWNQQAYLKASNPDAEDFFGFSVAIAGDTVVVSASEESSIATGVDGDQSDNSADSAGAAYVFTRSGSTWSQQAYLKASNTEELDFFGESVAITGDTVVVSASNESSNATGVDGDQGDNSANSAGAAYVFTRSGSTWSQQAYLKASNTDAQDLFGFSIAIASNTVVVGASDESSNATGVNGNQSDNSADNSGATYIFTRSGGIWSQQAYLKASNPDAGDFFGFSVAIAENTVVISASNESSNTTGVDGDQSDNSVSSAGAVYVFTRSGGTWSQQAYLKASNPDARDFFGFSVAIAGNTAVIGASDESSSAAGVNGNQSNNSARSAGAAYVFVRSGSTWSQQAYLKASTPDAGDFFGFSVAIAGDTLVVGAGEESSNATGIDGDQSDNSADVAGATYVFNVSTSTGECTLDADGDGRADALTDGVLFIRYMFGIRSASLVNNATGSNCTHCSAAELEPILEQCGTTDTSDIDGNGQVDALTDGLLVIRYLFGLRGDALITGSVANDCSRCTVLEIETYFQGLVQ
jgi:hypothetical protein